MEEAVGKLYLVATPIGNLQDISQRALEVFHQVDLIAAEDTRNTLRLLNHLGIKKPLTSYHEYNKVEKADALIEVLQRGNRIALVTDAGMPAISDPGEVMVQKAYEAGVEVTIIPGPCAAVSALAISGLSTRRFCFEAFLPADKRMRAEILAELQAETRTIVIYEAPHRLLKTLKELSKVLGEERRISLVRELTKLHEEVQRGSIGELIRRMEAPEHPLLIRGEYVLVVEGRSLRKKKEAEQAEWAAMSVAEHVAFYESQGMERKEAMRAAARDRGVSRRDIYRTFL
ncbi:16S rRNA (cytidine(1402)-2'-O)-methyltransferase [Lachnospiraceae bacterium]|nr:16S rRNA (cytidine(1402)-2'-O)-methyltransferase [Lachnospiraceae bacterium]